MTDAESLARLFHETYERLAPQYGYETREDTKEFDAESPNGKLMIAVCGEVAARLEVLEIYDMAKPLPLQLEQAVAWEWE